LTHGTGLILQGIRLENAFVSNGVRILLDVKRGLPAQQRISAAKAGTTCSNTRILISWNWAPRRRISADCCPAFKTAWFACWSSSCAFVFRLLDC
jgi:hypothetical protein